MAEDFHVPAGALRSLADTLARGRQPTEADLARVNLNDDDRARALRRLQFAAEDAEELWNDGFQQRARERVRMAAASIIRDFCGGKDPGQRALTADEQDAERREVKEVIDRVSRV